MAYSRTAWLCRYQKG